MLSVIIINIYYQLTNTISIRAQIWLLSLIKNNYASISRQTLKSLNFGTNPAPTDMGHDLKLSISLDKIELTKV